MSTVFGVCLAAAAVVVVAGVGRYVRRLGCDESDLRRIEDMPGHPERIVPITEWEPEFILLDCLLHKEMPRDLRRRWS